MRPVAKRGSLFLDSDNSYISRVYGYSVLGMPLTVILPTRSAVKPGLIIAGIHGCEPDTTVVVSAALRMRSSFGLWAVILCANPDGLTLGTRGNARGVDLNRNFPSSTWSCDTVMHRWTLECPQEVELSSGSAPASEPETAALLSLIYDLDPPVIISVHGPLGVINGFKNSPLTIYLSEQSKLPIEENLGYETPGSFGTFCDEISLQNVTYELPRHSIELLMINHATVFATIMDKPPTDFTHKQ